MKNNNKNNLKVTSGALYHKVTTMGVYDLG